MAMFTDEELQTFWHHVKLEYFATGDEDGVHWYDNARAMAFLDIINVSFAVSLNSVPCDMLMPEFYAKLAAGQWIEFKKEV
jgi:hypothetical protein